MKKRAIALVLSALMVTGLVGCGSGDKTEANFKVGMVTDAGTIDDKSFNQGSWEGIQKASKDLSLESKYLQPDGEAHPDYMIKIKDLYDAGFKFMVTPGFKFETAIGEAQTKYEDAKFVILDGSPVVDKKATVGQNAVSIFFAEEQSGFIAGVATALELKEGKLGFIGGMKIPPVQKFNWGFQQGVAYANENLGTKMELNKENIQYQGTFTDAPAGQQIAATMYDSGVKAIFCSAGGVGSGAITEAKARTAKGQEAWVVGVDVDQYSDGIYDEANNKSAVLTSAMKMIDKAAYDMIEKETKGEFPGGQTLKYDITNDGVGIPAENPNLSEETVKAVNEVVEKLKSGDIKVAAEQGSLHE